MKRILALVFIVLCAWTPAKKVALLGSSVIPIYPPVQNATYVKATGSYGGYAPYYATDPTKTITGNDSGNGWVSAAFANQRFHIDLGAPFAINRVYYENSNQSGGYTNRGIKDFTLWGSNTAADFADTTYADSGTWVQLVTSPTQMVQHVAADKPDPHYIVVTPVGAYRYYAFKFASVWGAVDYYSIRRVVLQVSTPPKR